MIAWAVAEQGAGVELSGFRVQYPQTDAPLKEMRGFISQKFLPEKMKNAVEPVLEQKFGTVDTYLCCAHEYIDILAGKAYLSLYSRIRPWDHLAGAMMMRESGGTVKKWDKSDYTAADQRGGIICAPDENTWQRIHDLLLKGYATSFSH